MDVESCGQKLKNWEATEKKCTAAGRHLFGFMNDMQSLEQWGVPLPWDDNFQLYAPGVYTRM